MPSYLSKVGTLNFGGNTRLGTKLIVLASTKPYTSFPRPLNSLQGAQAFVELRYSRIVPMTFSLISPIPLDR